MTVPATPRRAGPYTGNGVTLTFPFSFKVFSAADLRVDLATDAGIESLGVLNDTFTVSLNADQTATPGGTVSYAVSGVATALPTGYSLAITGARALAQTVTLPTGGAYHASSVEGAMDSLQMQIQQVDEGVGRALTLSPLAPSGTSTTLPAPGSNKLIGWNEAATGLQNMDPGVLATIVAFGTTNADQFTGNGSQTVFSLSASPGALNNLDVSIGGATQRPGVDYTWASGTTLTFTSAPPSGVPILVRYMQGLPQGVADASAIPFDWGFLPSTINKIDWGVYTAATGVNALRYIPPSEWPNIIARTPSIDIAAWVNPGIAANSELYFPPGKYIISTLTPVYGSKIRGAGKYANTGTEFISTTNAPMISFGGSPTGGANVSFVEIRGIRFTGLKTAGTSQHCVQVYPQQSFITFRDCHIVAMGGNGLHFTGTVIGAGNDQWTVKDCKIEQCLGYGVYCDTQLATSIFEQVEVYANNAGGWYLNSSYKIDNNYFIRCHTRDNGNTTGPAHGWDIGSGVQDCYWQSCWCESNGERAGLTDPTHKTAGWYIHTGAASTLTFESCRNSVHARGFWITGNTTGVRLIDPSFLNLTAWRTSVDILIDSGSSAYIEDPISNGELVIAITDNRSVVKYNGIASPVGTNARIARGSQYSFNDGSTVRYLVGGSVTYGLYGATCACTAGSNIIVAAAGHPMRIGDRVLIPGAGTAGAILQAYITDMSVANLNITLDRNVITTVAAASVVTGQPFASAGTFTPVISGATTAGAGTYTSQTGSYQIDEYGYCTVNLSAAWTAHTGAGTCLVSLPIACAESAVGSIWPTNYTFGAGNFPMILATAGQSYCQLRTFSDGGAGAALALDTAASLSATLRYKVTLPV